MASKHKQSTSAQSPDHTLTNCDETEVSIQLMIIFVSAITEIHIKHWLSKHTKVENKNNIHHSVCTHSHGSDTLSHDHW